MKRIFMAMAMTTGLIVSSCAYGAGPDTQVDSLIEKLMDKGILNKEEAKTLKGRISYDEKTLRESNVKKDLPEWVQNTKLSGDFRVRNQLEHRRTENVSETTRDRGRMRARLGVETKINDKYKVALGLATDGGSPRSNNQTFDSTFAKGNVVLNYAYAQFAPNDRLTIMGGQMKNPIWEPMEFLWDSDLTPTGAALQYNHKIYDNLSAFTLASAFVVRDLAVSNADPFLYVLQGGLKGKWLGDKADYKVAGAYQGVQNNTKTLLNGQATNTLVSSKYKYRYNTPFASAEIGLNDPLGEGFPLYVPRLGVFGEFAYNPHPKDESKAWMAGAYLGNSTVTTKGAWKLTGAFKSMGRDAWLDVLPDSDFWSGATDTKGYEVIVEYGLAKNVTIAVDYYRTQRGSSLVTKQNETLLQTDINLKF